MPISRTDAIVLRSYKYSETSKIVTLYTKAFGKTKVIAKGARKPKSKFGSALEPITEIRAIFYTKEGRELHTLSEADLIYTFAGVKSNFDKLTYASAIVELTDRLVIGEESNIGLYRALQGTLSGIECAPQNVAEKLLWYFQLRVADLFGYRPKFAHCIRCGQSVIDQHCRFDLAQGGIVCGNCVVRAVPIAGETSLREGRYVDLDGRSVAFLNRLQNARPDQAADIMTREGLRGEIREALRCFLEYHTEDHRKLKSLDFLDKMNDVLV